ncbi:MAG: DNA polymerase subunit beta [Methylothermaceae bacteria B42]|nr:MAG: DNA polymerase subunit beta [Methylothermaceae bacteria B42]HHJ39011.1 DNA polymerase subunit beta [Methylothermaceae bacterium]
MKRQDAMRQLQAHLPELKRRFGVKSLALFGSTARNTAGPESDLDILVVFDGPTTSSRYFGLQFYLEDLLGVPIDLITDKALRPELRPVVERDAIYV